MTELKPADLDRLEELAKRAKRRLELLGCGEFTTDNPEALALCGAAEMYRKSLESPNTTLALIALARRGMEGGAG